MKKRLFLVLFLGVAPFLMAQKAPLEKLHFLTEEFPPYNYMEKGQLAGSSPEILAALFQQLKAPQTLQEVKVLPWARAYSQLGTDPWACLFSTTKTKEREPLFQWVGPISPARNVVITLASKHLTLAPGVSLAQSNWTFGAVRDDAGEQLLIANHVPTAQISLTTNALQALEMLNSGRIDAFAYDESVIDWLARSRGWDPSRYQVTEVLETGYHYFAFNLKVPAEVIKEFQQALDHLKTTGQYQQILKKYGVISPHS